MKKTKQGVRDLDDLKSKPAGIRLPSPPVPVDCKHKHRKTVHADGLYWLVCEDCNESIGEPW